MDTDESRLSRDESRLSKDESRISRDESRLSRDESSLEDTPFIQVDSMKMESIESIKHEFYPTPSHTPRRSASRLVYCQTIVYIPPIHCIVLNLCKARTDLRILKHFFKNPPHF